MADPGGGGGGGHRGHVPPPPSLNIHECILRTACDYNRIHVLTGADLGGGTAGMYPPPPPFNNPTIYSHDVARYSIIGVFSCVFKRTLIAERSDRPCTAFVAHMVIHT